MQKVNVNTPIVITGRHVEVTDAIRDFVYKKVEGIHLDYPRIQEVKVIIDVQKERQIAEVILFCSDHITIDASTTQSDLYAAIDETFSKIMRRMRKHKTRLLKKYRPHKQDTIRNGTHEAEMVLLEQTVYDDSVFDHPEESANDPEPTNIKREGYELMTIYKEEAILALDMSDKPFVLFRSARTGILEIVYHLPDGSYSIIELGEQL